MAAAAARALVTLSRVPLRARLTVWVVAMVVLIQLLLGVAFWVYEREKATADLDSRLAIIARGLAAELQLADPDDRRATFSLSLRSHALLHEARWYSAEYEIDGTIERVSRRGEGQPRSAALSAEAERADGVPGGGRVATAVHESASCTVRLIVTRERIEQRLAFVVTVLSAATVFGAFASGISGWFIAGLATRPLTELASAATRATLEMPEAAGEEWGPGVDAAIGRGTSEIAERLEASVESTKQTLEAQARFLSNVSHELKTPIATILLEAQTLDRSGMPGDGAEFVLSVEDEMRKLGNLVESFLMLTRVTNADAEVSQRTVLANEVIMDAVADCDPSARQYGVRIEPSLADDDAGLDAMILGDAELLRTAVNNLVRNAIRFSPRGEVVSVVGVVRGGVFEIRVRDRGEGIPKDVLGNIFDRFVRSSGEARRGRGHGLGLAIAKGIAELHGGDITAANHPDGGAVFTVMLPIQQDKRTNAG